MKIRVALVLLLTALVYTPTLRFGFVYDDGAQIIGNPLVQSWSYVPGYFTQQVWAQQPGTLASYYRPLFLFWLRIQHAIFGLNPVGWHAMSVLLHVLVTFLVFLLARSVSGDESIALISSLIFGLHPAHIEAVAWISGSTDLLAAAFFIASLLAYLRWRNYDARPSNAAPRVPQASILCSSGCWLILSAASYGCAVLAKEVALVLPLVLIAYELLPSGEATRLSRRQLLAAIAAFGAITAIYFVLRQLALGSPVLPASNSVATVLSAVPAALWLYARHLLAPAGLALLYPPLATGSQIASIALPLLAFAIVAVMASVAARHDRLLQFALALLALPLLPALLAMRSLPADALVHDRYLYLPSIGFALCAGLLLARLRGAPKVFGVSAAQLGATAAIGVFFAVAVVSQQRAWASNVALYARAVEIAPQNPTALNGLADAKFAAGDRDAALQLYERSLALDPNRWATNFGLGIAYFRMSHYAEADHYLSRAVDIAPARPYQGFALALARRRLGRLPEAEAALRQAISYWPQVRGFHLELGEVLAQEGKLDEAREEFEREMQLDPGSEEAKRALAALPQ